MLISVSNIAWNVDEEGVVAGLLAQMGVDRVDIAPGKYFADPEQASAAEVEAIRTLWAKRGFAIEGMQALLFGTVGLNMFNDPDERMFRRLAAMCHIAGGVGARSLTFGSPRQRDRSGIDEALAERMAVDFFRRVGDVAGEADVLFCLEPNPVGYGCNFMTTTANAAAIVEAVHHPAIRLQLDVGAMTMNEEAIGPTITRFAAILGHVHASEPMLVTLDARSSSHAEAARALSIARPELVVTVEMAASATEPAASAVARAVSIAQATYGAASS